MQTQVQIDDRLFSEAQRVTGLTSAAEVVEAALKEPIARRRDDPLARVFGAFPWDGDLDAMRTDR